MGLERCSNNFHGRIITNKGQPSLWAMDSKEKLLKAWYLVNKWEMTSLGSSFNEFFIQSIKH